MIIAGECRRAYNALNKTGGYLIYRPLRRPALLLLAIRYALRSVSILD
jgi:hypothetical protein